MTSFPLGEADQRFPPVPQQHRREGEKGEGSVEQPRRGEAGVEVKQVRVLGGRQQNYVFASSLEPKLVRVSPGQRDPPVIAVASGHCPLWYQHPPPCNVRLAFYDARTLHPLRLFDLRAGPQVEHLAWHPTKPIVALATSMVDYFGQQYMGGQLFLLDWKTGRRAALLHEARPVTYCRFMPDDARLIFRVAGRADLGEEDTCYELAKHTYSTWRNGCAGLDRLRRVDELVGSHKTGNRHALHHREDQKAKEDSDEMMSTFCFIEEDVVDDGRPHPGPDPGSLFHEDELKRESRWERKLQQIAADHGKVYETSKTVWGVDFHHDTNQLCVTKWGNALEVWSCKTGETLDWSKRVRIFSHYDSGLQIKSLKDVTGEDAVIVTEALLKPLEACSHSEITDVSSGRTEWARHFDLGVNYSARINRTGHILIECSELPPENSVVIAPDGKIVKTEIPSPLLHGVPLYNFCQKQTDELYYCSKDGADLYLCRYHPIMNTYEQLFPLRVFGTQFERLRNGVFIKDELGESLILDVTTKFKSVHLMRVELRTGKKIWDTQVKYDVCEIALVEDVQAVAFAQPEGYVGLLSCVDGRKLYWEQVSIAGVVTPITSLSVKGTQMALGTTDGRVAMYKVCLPSFMYHVERSAYV